MRRFEGSAMQRMVGGTAWIRLRGAGIALALIAFAAGISAQQALDDPVPEPIRKGDTMVALEDFVRAPRSVDPARPSATNAAYARIQYLLPVPDGRRLAFNDTRGILYLTDIDGSPPSVYLDLRRRQVGFSNAAFPNEAGFLGFAFHPEFAVRGKPGYGKFYTAFSATPGSGVADYEDSGAVQDSVIREWTATDPSADAFSGTSREVLRVGQFAPNHNVGTIAFNPTANEQADDYGLLYICFGDGGGAHDPRNHGQTLRVPLGVIARIDPLETSNGRGYGIPASNPFVGQAGAAEEIWAYGLRHPQQFSWDADGRLFIGDIGQDQIEEINLGVAGGNYGWRLREGTFATAHAVGASRRGPVFPLPANDPASFIYPVALYDHDEGFAVGGGYVYSGAIAALRGKYVFTDFPRGRLFAINADGLRPGMPAPIEELRLRIDGREQDLVDVAGFYNTYTGGQRVDARLGTDHDGELYVLAKGDGWIRKLVGLAGPMTDANIYRVPLFLAAARAPQQGFVRIVNHSSVSGAAHITATDDAGRRLDPFVLELDANETRHFNSDDLENGNALKGIKGIGSGTGDWRLEITSPLRLEVLAYVRTGDGFLTSMHDTTRQPGLRHLVPIFNPASNTRQVSSLRLTCRGGTDAEVTIVGVDDAGSETPELSFGLAASQSRTFTAQQLEAGAAALDSALGDGEGKWRLYVSADQPIDVMHLLASPTGHLANLSSTATDTDDADYGLPSEAMASGADPVSANFRLADENNNPSGIAFADGRFYVTDDVDHKVYAYTATGQRAPAMDFDLGSDSQEARGVAHAGGKLHVVDGMRHRVLAYTLAGERQPQADFDLHESNQTPAGIAYAQDRFHVADGEGRVFFYANTGQPPSTEAFELNAHNSAPAGIAYAARRLYVLDDAGRVFAYRTDGRRDAYSDFALSQLNPADWRGITATDGRLHVLDATNVDAHDGDLHNRHIPLLTSASNVAQQGFIRIVNHTARTGTVAIHAIDDAGTRVGPVQLSLAPWQAKHFRAIDLETGNPDKGIPRGVGAGRGDWRLEVVSDVDVEALAYIRTMDGFLTSIHDTASERGQEHSVPIFNPGSNQNQASLLRLVNRTQSDVEVTVVGTDDGGMRSPAVRLDVAAGQARAISAQELESNGLGDGQGKWHLAVSAGAPMDVMSLIESTSGHVTNLSTPNR